MVAANATSGTVRVQQGGVWSNAANPVTFSVTRATVSDLSAYIGAARDPITFTRTNFGAVQGNGQVWLGTAYGDVQSWNNTQIVAKVAAGSATGVAQVMQGGVWSTPVAFTVKTPHLDSITPASGAELTSVTINGSGFGATQGTGSVVLGSKDAGTASTWSDNTVIANVPIGSLSGIVRIQQNGVWSNAVGFVVPTQGSTAAKLAPTLLNMAVGDTRTLQALNAAGQPVTGLIWTSTNTAVVSLSSDNPPVLTALAVGHVTISAGGASSDVTVSPGPLTPGTVLWSIPTSGSTVNSIVPAVPSATGVADMFSFQSDGTIQAITSDGAVAWTANVCASRTLYDHSGTVNVLSVSTSSRVPPRAQVVISSIGAIVFTGAGRRSSRFFRTSFRRAWLPVWR